MRHRPAARRLHQSLQQLCPWPRPLVRQNGEREEREGVTHRHTQRDDCCSLRLCQSRVHCRCASPNSRLRRHARAARLLCRQRATRIRLRTLRRRRRARCCVRRERRPLIRSGNHHRRSALWPRHPRCSPLSAATRRRDPRGTRHGRGRTVRRQRVRNVPPLGPPHHALAVRPGCRRRRSPRLATPRRH